MLKFLIVIVLVLFTSCNNFSTSIENKVDKEVNETKEEMLLDNDKAKSAFIVIYNQSLKSMQDTVRKEVQMMYDAIIKTSASIDSLRKIIDNLNYKNANNVNVINDMFIANNAGSLLYERISASYSLAERISLGKNKSLIKSYRTNTLNDLNSKEWSERFFGMTDPVGYGFDFKWVTK